MGKTLPEIDSEFLQNVVALVFRNTVLPNQFVCIMLNGLVFIFRETGIRVAGDAVIRFVCHGSCPFSFADSVPTDYRPAFFRVHRAKGDMARHYS